MKRWHLKFNGSLVRASELHQNLNMIGEDQPNENAQRYHCIFDWTWEAIGEFSSLMLVNLFCFRRLVQLRYRRVPRPHCSFIGFRTVVPIDVQKT